MNVTSALERQNELQQRKNHATPRKLKGRSAISLPMSDRCNPKLLQAISDYSLHASYYLRRLSIIKNPFFNCCEVVIGLHLFRAQLHRFGWCQIF
jgi:hypothetical protein